MRRISKIRRKPLTEMGRLRIGLSLAWLFVWLLLLITGGCTQTVVEDGIIPPHDLKDVEAGFNLNVLANRDPLTRSITFTADGTIEADTLAVAAKDSVQTKAASSLTDEQESTIDNLWVGQYDASTKQCLFSQYFSSMTTNSVNLKLKQNGENNRSRVYFIANAGDFGTVADEKNLQVHTLDYSSTDNGLPSDDLCRMTGMWEGVVKEGGVKDINVSLTRLLAKITFTYSIGGSGFSFTPTSVTLNSVPQTSQIEAPTNQLNGISYGSYAGEISSSGATMHWYLPENMAGTSGDTVDSEKKKTGKGVDNATFIELTGDAVENGINYKDVTFRFYPGTDKDNYDITRNSYYSIEVTLVGIDVSDERITVGGVPPIVVDPTEMAASKGSVKDIQIIARTGQKWSFVMPDCLSAMIANQQVPAGATVTYQGPCLITFKAEEANPKAEKREIAFDVDMEGEKQSLKIVQTGSTLIKGNAVTLQASVGSEGATSFAATKGIPWLATLNAGSWLDWAASNPGTTGDEATGGSQALYVAAASSNPYSYERKETITVKAGASIKDPAYTGLVKEIVVSQQGSTVTGSTVQPESSGGVSKSSFTATKGLKWLANVTNGSWITLTDGASGSSTTGVDQTIKFKTNVNPTSSPRQGDITVRVGDDVAGPTGTITVNQKPAYLKVSGTNNLGPTVAAGVATSNFTATAGLPWTMEATSSDNWLILTSGSSGTSASTTRDIIFDVYSTNPNSTSREGVITIKVGNGINGTDPGLVNTIKVVQKGAELSAGVTKATFSPSKNDDGVVNFKGTWGMGVWVTLPDWLQFKGNPDFPVVTDATQQSVVCSTTQTNLNSGARTGTISVKTAGNLVNYISVEQKGSEFSLSATEINLTGSASSSTVQINATPGLPWTVNPSSSNGITPGITSETANGSDQNLMFSATENNSWTERSATFTIAVPGGDHTRTLTVKQAGLVCIGPIQVCNTQETAPCGQLNAQSACENMVYDGRDDWRLPTVDEMSEIVSHQAEFAATSGVTPLIDHYYRTSTPTSSTYSYVVKVSTGEKGPWPNDWDAYVRCVRDKK